MFFPLFLLWYVLFVCVFVCVLSNRLRLATCLCVVYSCFAVLFFPFRTMGIIRIAIQWCHCHAFITPPNLQYHGLLALFAAVRKWHSRGKTFSILSRYYSTLCCNICFQIPTTDAFNTFLFCVCSFVFCVSLFIRYLLRCGFFYCCSNISSQGNRKKGCHVNSISYIILPREFFRGAHIRFLCLDCLFSKRNVAGFFSVLLYNFCVPLVKILVVFPVVLFRHLICSYIKLIASCCS